MYNDIDRLERQVDKLKSRIRDLENKHILNKVHVGYKLLKDGKTPEFSTDHAAGADLFAAEDMPIGIGQTVAVRTGLMLAIPEGWEGQVRTRSGLSMKGIVVPNSPGTIDADYRGEVKVVLHNQSDSIYDVQKGDKIAQLVIKPTFDIEFDYQYSLESTARGDKGFGSTGR